ncbi:MAG: hypothetical protein K0S82_1414 [Gaiellaceae bacterium]|nr:hypothetical protein [Gaiellaceae bacterium]
MRVHKVLKTEPIGSALSERVANPRNDGGSIKDRSLAQTLALLFGIAFLGVGILGFIPGITTNLGDIELAGRDSPAELVLFLYGLFIDQDSDANFVSINTADNWLHLVLGAGLLGGWFISKGAGEGTTDRRATTPTPPAA